MKYKSILTVLLAFALAGPAFAQETLTLEEAVKIALDKNYDIRLSSNDLQVSRNNITKAALLPAVTATAGNTTNIQNTTQTQSNGQEVTRRGARNSNLSYGIGLNWTVFDGFSMFAAYDQLKELEKLGETSLKSTVLTTVYDVINTFYDIVRLQQQLRSSVTAVDISRFRLTTAQNRYTIGRAAKLEVLAAKVDLNTDTTNLLRQRDLIQTTKIRLNELMARDVNTPFTIRDTLIINSALRQEEVLNTALQMNPALQSAVVNRRIAELNLKVIRGGRYPVIGVNSGYNFSRSESELGFARNSNGRGFNYGFNASINVFNGFLQKKNERNAAIGIESAGLDYQRAEISLRSQLSSAWQTYITSLTLVRLEAANTEVARQNLDITLEKFKLGSIAPIEFREAQRNFVDASVRFTDAQYDAKVAEMTLRELSGNINLN